MRLVVAVLAVLLLGCSDTAVGDHGWNWWMDPRVIRHGAKTWVGGVSGDDGHVSVTEYPGGTVTDVYSGAFEVDDHASPALHRFADGTLLAVFSEHNGDVWMNMSTNPDDATAWGTASEIFTGSYSYPQLYELDGVLHLFLRSGNATSANLVRATWGGSSWSALSTSVPNGIYTKMVRSGDRLYACFTRDPSVATTFTMRAGYLEGGSWYQMDGTAVSPSADSSFDAVSANARPRAYDIAIGADGHPRIVYQHYTTYPTSSTYRHARWTGSAWDVDDIVFAGGNIGDPAGINVGGIAIDHEDVSTVYASREIDGVWQMFEYTTTDDGATWSGQQLTGAEVDQIRPAVPADRAGYRPVFWLSGDWDALDDYSLDLAGLAVAAPSSLAGVQSAWPSLRPG